MISDFFDTTFNVYRETWTDNKSSEEKVATFQGHIQRTDDTGLVEQLDSVLTRTFDVWCPVDANVEEGDTIRSDYEYSVRVVNAWDMGKNSHKKLVVELTGGGSANSERSIELTGE